MKKQNTTEFVFTNREAIRLCDEAYEDEEWMTHGVGIQRLSEACDRIEQLQAELDKAKQENEHLCNVVEATRQDYADMLAGTLEGKLQAKLDTAKTLAETRRGLCKAEIDSNRRLEAELNKHRWIPVEERLPEVSNWFLVFDGQDVWVHLWMASISNWYSSKLSLHSTITHWQPIILPPKEAT